MSSLVILMEAGLPRLKLSTTANSRARMRKKTTCLKRMLVEDSLSTDMVLLMAMAIPVLEIVLQPVRTPRLCLMAVSSKSATLWDQADPL